MAGDGPRGADDNCKAEFDYTFQRKGVQHMVAVVMDDEVRGATLSLAANAMLTRLLMLDMVVVGDLPSGHMFASAHM